MGTDTKILHIQWRTGIFLKKVKSKRTDEYFQAEGFLIKRELVPSDRQPTHVDTKDKPLKYLIKSVIALSERLADGSEWLVSRQCGHAWT
jgi:hypothetical protein